MKKLLCLCDIYSSADVTFDAESDGDICRSVFDKNVNNLTGRKGGILCIRIINLVKNVILFSCKKKRGKFFFCIMGKKTFTKGN